MYSFEGDFKRKPVQSLGGASKKVERNKLLQKAQEEREKREEQRLKLSSAVKIQSYFRSAKCRCEKKNEERCKFDATFQHVQKSTSSVSSSTLAHLCRELVFFYKQDKDRDRLTLLCQLLLKQKDDFVRALCGPDNKHTKLFLLNKLLLLCCRHLEEVCRTSNPIAVPLRMLEVFTCVSTFSAVCGEGSARATVQTVLHFLINKGYFGLMRTLVNARVPSSLEWTGQSPTPLAASILQLMMRPLSFISVTADHKYKKNTLQHLCREILCPAFTEQVSQFLLPAMVHNVVSPFPFVEMLHALIPTTENNTDTSSPCSDVPELKVEPTPWLLYAVLNLSAQYLEKLGAADIVLYLRLLQKLVPQLNLSKTEDPDDDMSDSDDEADMVVMDTRTGSLTSIAEVREECIHLLDSMEHVKGIVSTVSRNPDTPTLTAVCTVCYALMSSNRLSVLRMRLLYSLAFNPTLLKNLWHACVSVSTTAVTGAQTPLIHMLSRGLSMSQQDLDRLVPLLAVFCSLFSYSLISLHDSEFYGHEMDPVLGSIMSKVISTMPFSLSELVPLGQMLRDVCLGIIELAHPDTRPTLQEDYKKAFLSVGAKGHVVTAENLQKQRHTWAYLFKTVSQLVRQLHARDTRHPFCPPDHWLAWRVNIQADKPSQIYRAENPVFVRRPFGALSNLKKKELDEEGPPLSNTEVKNLTILTELPFAVSFQERVKILQKLIHADRLENQGEMYRFLQGSTINIMVRRNYLYEDAFDKLSPENEPNLKLRMQVQLINFAGLDEAGIDGGGLFREFLSELLKTGFDPNRGFFRNTQDRLLYPNPQAKVIVENFTQHYYFLGRMLGKAIYENMLVELPFASFFLSKILSRHRGDVDIHHLASLDPEMYKNLLFLKQYDGDVTDLGLDFTVFNSELGQTEVEELKPGGKDIAVTSNNRIEYIHLMADYRLNKQIRTHCNAFRQGMSDIINLEWLRMFDPQELQVLISGAPVPVDLSDLKKHTNYSGGYNVEHPVIRAFWKVVAEFTDTQKRQLLKFVTSCSRPPLLGFKELYPAFCIHHGGGEEDRLPTASTCMNLLKLPEFKDEQLLRSKLLYAVESGAGFELS